MLERYDDELHKSRDHKRMKKQELKVAVMYEGWEKDGKDNNRPSEIMAKAKHINYEKSYGKMCI
jgi:hypothetical protein